MAWRVEQPPLERFLLQVVAAMAPAVGLRLALAAAPAGQRQQAEMRLARREALRLLEHPVGALRLRPAMRL